MRVDSIYVLSFSESDLRRENQLKPLAGRLAPISQEVPTDTQTRPPPGGKLAPLSLDDAWKSPSLEDNWKSQSGRWQ